jgi:hypothetical protein
LVLDIIKAGIWKERLIVITLTGNEESANFMLSTNNLAYVRPLVTVAMLQEIRQVHKKITPNTPVPLDWVKYVRRRTSLKGDVGHFGG